MARDIVHTTPGFTCTCVIFEIRLKAFLRNKTLTKVTSATVRRLNRTNGFLFGLTVTDIDKVERNYKRLNKNGLEYYKNYMKLPPDWRRTKPPSGCHQCSPTITGQLLNNPGGLVNYELDSLNPERFYYWLNLLAHCCSSTDSSLTAFTYERKRQNVKHLRVMCRLFCSTRYFCVATSLLFPQISSVLYQERKRLTQLCSFLCTPRRRSC